MTQQSFNTAFHLESTDYTFNDPFFQFIEYNVVVNTNGYNTNGYNTNRYNTNDYNPINGYEYPFEVYIKSKHGLKGIMRVSYQSLDINKVHDELIEYDFESGEDALLFRGHCRYNKDLVFMTVKHDSVHVSDFIIY